MIRDTIRKLEERIHGALGASEETRRDLLALLDDLRGELEGLEKTHASEAEGIADRALAVANGSPDAEEADEGEGLLQEIGDALEEFELTHPRLQGVLRTFFKTLSNAGI
jgi:hypothetical protein